MANLPTVGGSDGSWGSDLNTFLRVAHNADGTLKFTALGSYAAGTILGKTLPLTLTTDVTAGDDIGPVVTTTDGFLLCSINAAASADKASIDIKVDSANPPTTVRANLYAEYHDRTARSAFACVPVKKGEYIRCVTTASSNCSRTYNWIPFGE